jgi:precorrin-6Y C5,15-methyltransferase (decarboxylating)
MNDAIVVVGLHGGLPYGPGAVAALEAADLIVGSARQLAGVVVAVRPDVERVELRGSFDTVFDRIDEAAKAGRRVCVLASGDPGFFGIVRALGRRFEPHRLLVHPAPSSVALAFARLGRSWDDAAVVSAHGRPLTEAVAAVMAASNPSIAVLTSPDNPPHVVGRALFDAGLAACEVAVASHLGDARESVTHTDLAGLVAGTFDPMSVVVILPSGPASGSGATLAWGRPEAEFEHRDGMITKAEVRAVALGKLALPRTGVLWDVGAGSGSVAIECARLARGLRVFAIERVADDAARIRANAAEHGVEVEAVEGEAPLVLADLPAPDRVFIGGGGIDVLDAALARLRPGGLIVANYAVVDRAVVAAQRLGNLVEVSVSRGVATGAIGLRLRAENPVFVCWGPEA